jgi:hypothetical protein
MGHPILLWARPFAGVGGPVGFDFDGGGFDGCVVVEAAPAVVLGFRDEASGDWVAVDVLDFLFEFTGSEDVEVVVTGLPEVAALPLRSLEDSPLMTRRQNLFRVELLEMRLLHLS